MSAYRKTGGCLCGGTGSGVSFIASDATHECALEHVDRGYDARMSNEGLPKAADLASNGSPDDGIMEDDLTEERDVTPEEREDVAETQKMDP
jgi:hypothetical protein